MFQVIDALLKSIATEYSIPENSLKRRYIEGNRAVKWTFEELDELPIYKLKAMCKKWNLRVSGSKTELVKRLLDPEKFAVKRSKPAKRKDKKRTIPVHNHPLDNMMHPECPHCREYGNMLCTTHEWE